jgi:type VI protein secretion system component VasK
MPAAFVFLFIVMTAARGAKAEFGPTWNLVLTLDVINTVVVLFYLWRIWREKPGTPATRNK